MPWELCSMPRDTKDSSSGYVSGMSPWHEGGPCNAPQLLSTHWHTDKPQNPLEMIQSLQQAYLNRYISMFKEWERMSMQGLKLKKQAPNVCKTGFGKEIKVKLGSKTALLSILRKV